MGYPANSPWIAAVLALLVAAEVTTTLPRTARAAGKRQIVVPLAYQALPEEEDADSVAYGDLMPTVEKKAPEGKWRLPKLVSSEPRYAVVKHGDQRRLIVLDVSSDKAKTYDRMYYDTNGNGDLTDDPVVEATNTVFAGNEYAMCRLSRIETTLVVGGKKAPYCFEPEVTKYAFDLPSDPGGKTQPVAHIMLRLKTRCLYEGSFAWNGKKHRLLAIDYNGNGVFGERSAPDEASGARETAAGASEEPLPPDLFSITSRDGEARVTMRVSEAVSLGGRLYSMAIDVHGRGAVLTPRESEGLVAVRTIAGTEGLELTSPDGSYVAVWYGGKEILLPPGDYRIDNYSLFREDEEGDLWQVRAHFEPDAKATKVRKGDKPAFRFGPPYRTDVGVSDFERERFEKAKKKGAVSLGFGLVGVGGERVSMLERVEGDKTKIPISEKSPGHPLEPRFKIVKADGETVFQGSFEYG